MNELHVWSVPPQCFLSDVVEKFMFRMLCMARSTVTPNILVLIYILSVSFVQLLTLHIIAQLTASKHASWNEMDQLRSPGFTIHKVVQVLISTFGVAGTLRSCGGLKAALSCAWRPFWEVWPRCNDRSWCLWHRLQSYYFNMWLYVAYVMLIRVNCYCTAADYIYIYILCFDVFWFEEWRFPWLAAMSYHEFCLCKHFVFHVFGFSFSTVIYPIFQDPFQFETFGSRTFFGERTGKSAYTYKRCCSLPHILTNCLAP